VCGREVGGVGVWAGGVWRAGVVGVWRAGVCGGRAGIVGAWRAEVCGGRGCGGRGCGASQACQVLRLGPPTRPAAEGLASDVDYASASAGRCTRRSRPPALGHDTCPAVEQPAADAVAWSWTRTLRVAPDRSAVRTLWLLGCRSPRARRRRPHRCISTPATRRGRYGCGRRARRRSGLALRVRRVRVNSRCESSEGQRPRRAWYQVVPMPQERVPRITRKTMEP
jgi:hypothetical protein